MHAFGVAAIRRSALARVRRRTERPADDNASAVAGLIELARLLAVAPLSVRVELVAFTLEEPPAFGGPAMGSAVHARSLREAKARARAMLSLEMIACFSDDTEAAQKNFSSRNRPRAKSNGFQRSPSFSRRAGTLSMRKSSISIPLSISFQVTGVETVARGVGRTE